MKGLAPLLLGIFGTFAFSWAGLTLIPNIQIGSLTPQSDEEGTDIYPMPRSGMVERGGHVYAANGCAYCHSVWLRPEYAANDLERDRDYAPKVPWGGRRSAPRDYIFDRPVLLGKERMGPDLANMGKAAPSDEEPASAASPTPKPSPAKLGQEAYTAAWHHRHLYSPRSINVDSNMPAYRFLYQRRLIGSERSVDALELTGDDTPPAGWEIVPTFDAQCLVAYLMSLDQSHPLSEVKSGAPAASPAASAASPAAPGASPAAPAASPAAPGASLAAPGASPATSPPPAK
jgi:cytochrome c oxidase cbb3-type subunit 2